MDTAPADAYAAVGAIRAGRSCCRDVRTERAEKPPFQWEKSQRANADYFSGKRRFFLDTGKNADIFPRKSGKWC